jgi:abortive infection bacteriophage resistance protein
MKYTKSPITISEQIVKLQRRGLLFRNEQKAAHYLSNISYYRLRAYTFPFQNNSVAGQPFTQKIYFEDIIKLYVFDRKLRLLLYNAIEKIEIALRTQIIYQYAIVYGAFWHLNPALYNNSIFFASQIASLQKEVNRSNETFIKHYKTTYNDPTEPPAWMALEVSSIGLLSKMFSNLKDNPCKDEITKHFGLKAVSILENWMQCFSLLRNVCAHHGRVWNRRMTQLRFPKKPLNIFVANRNILPYKVYAYICSMQYVLNIISPGHEFKNNLIALMGNCPMLQEKEMGFPKNWKNEKIWQIPLRNKGTVQDPENTGTL